MIAIVDAGLGNVASVRNMIARLGFDAELRDSPAGLGAGDIYVLPGVGAFDEGVLRLQRTGWFDHLAGLPHASRILGICLGMQLLGRGSAEGVTVGLNRYPVDFVRFTDVPRVPHMGWNTVRPVNHSALFDPSFPEHRFYFSHTFRANKTDPELVIGTSRYGTDFVAACRLDGTYGVQFHPEKSHKFGMELLRRWLDGRC
jgi:glutamine amidotransferase